MDEKQLKNDFDANILGVFNTPSIWLDKGKGATVWDINGKRYLDFIAGIAVCGTGHCHPDVTGPLCEQAKQLIHCSNLYGIPKEVELAKRLCDISGFDKAFFSNSGAEANETAIKLARKWAHVHGKKHFEVITAKNSFHGRTLVTVTATGQPKYQKGFGPRPAGFHHVPYNDVEALKETVCGRTAAVMLELIQGEGGIIPASQEYVNCARDICNDTGTLLIFDEVQTGMGRTGKFFAFEHFGIRPDIITLAKALGSGFPIGATLATDDVARVFSPGDHGSTFGGNPLACTAALATLDVIKNEKLVENSAKMGAYLSDAIRLLAASEESHDYIESIRGKGLLVGVSFTKPFATIFKDTCAEKGLLVGSIGQFVMRLVPPLIVSKEQIDEAVDIIKDVCRIMAQH